MFVIGRIDSGCDCWNTVRFELKHCNNSNCCKSLISISKICTVFWTRKLSALFYVVLAAFSFSVIRFLRFASPTYQPRNVGAQELWGRNCSSLIGKPRVVISS